MIGSELRLRSGCVIAEKLTHALHTFSQPLLEQGGFILTEDVWRWLSGSRLEEARVPQPLPAPGNVDVAVTVDDGIAPGLVRIERFHGFTQGTTACRLVLKERGKLTKAAAESATKRLCLRIVSREKAGNVLLQLGKLADAATSPRFNGSSSLKVGRPNDWSYRSN